jgi:MoaA/NifB/PqqE/SkfB family radical SAM enzyme
MFTKRTKKALIKAVLTKKSPVYVQFAVTKLCNLKCRMCGSSVSRKEEAELTLPQIDKLADTLDKLNVGVILLTGGEVFLRPDIADIVRIFSRKGFTVRLQTNGILADENKIRAVCAAGVEEVTISLNTLIPERQDAITGQVGSWQKIIESIVRFSQVLPVKSTLLGINTVVTRENLEELPWIIRFVTEIGFYSSLIPIHLSPPGEDDFIIRKHSPESAFLPEDSSRIDEAYKQIIRMKRQGYNIYNSYKFLRNSPAFLEGKRINWHCDSPYLYFAISPSGNFLPCVDIKTSISMLDDGFASLYHSQDFQEKISRMVKKCAGCFYACWPEITYACRDPFVLWERAIFGLKAAAKARKPVSYSQCMGIIEKIRSESPFFLPNIK